MCHLSFLGLGVGNMSIADSSPDFIMFKVYWGQHTKNQMIRGYVCSAEHRDRQMDGVWRTLREKLSQEDI